jgi:hypothetical protein
MVALPTFPLEGEVMPTWSDVTALALRLPDARLGTVHDGSPAWYAGRHPFARYREDLGREIVQLWSGDMDLEAQLSRRRGTFLRIDTFEYRVTVWAFLDQLARRELAELLLDSYRIRGGKRRGERVEEALYFQGT